MAGTHKLGNGTPVRIMQIIDTENCSQVFIRNLLEKHEIESADGDLEPSLFKNKFNNQLVTVQYLENAQLISIMTLTKTPGEFSEDEIINLAEWFNRRYKYRVSTRVIRNNLFLRVEYLLPVMAVPHGFSVNSFVVEVLSACNFTFDLASRFKEFVSRSSVSR